MNRLAKQRSMFVLHVAEILSNIVTTIMTGKDNPQTPRYPPQTPRYLVQRSHNQWGSESQGWKHHRAIWRPPDFSDKTQKLNWYRHIWIGQDYPTGNSSRGRRTGKQKKWWEGNIKEWTGLEWNIMLRKAENRVEWRKLIVKSTLVPKRSARLQDR